MLKMNRKIDRPGMLGRDCLYRRRRKIVGTDLCRQTHFSVACALWAAQVQSPLPELAHDPAYIISLLDSYSGDLSQSEIKKHFVQIGIADRIKIGILQSIIGPIKKKIGKSFMP